jgi:hypothetical protein
MSGRRGAAALLLLVMANIANGQTAQDQLRNARSLAAGNKYAPAVKLVEKALLEPGNDLETTLELLELSGVCNAALKKAGPAKLSFQKLLTLAPGYTLKREGPPAAVKAFAEAKATTEPISIQPAAPDMSAGRISDVAVEVRADPLKLARMILFNYRVGGGKWKTRAVPATAGRVAARVDAPDRVEWYATVLGSNDAELMRIRNVDSPITHTYSAPVVKVADAPRKEELTPRSKELDLQFVEAPRKSGWVAPVSWTLIAAGAAAGGVGAYFGWQAGAARSEFATKTAGDSGVVTGLTRQQALELDGRARTNGMVANSLWVSAAVLVATGIVLRIVGPTEAPQ